MTAPYPLQTTASQWTLTEWLPIARASAPAGADGVALVDFGQLPDDVQWLIDRAVVSCTSTTPTAVRFYDSSRTPTQLLSGSASGNFDEADYPPGLLVRPSTTLLAVWTGASVGAVAHCRLQVRQFRRT